MIKLKDILSEGLSTSDIQSIVNEVYPKVIKYFGKKGSVPKIEIHNSIYARLSGVEGMVGEANPHAEYDHERNKIYLYKPKMTNREQVIRSIIHEYTHSKQDISKIEKYRKLGLAKLLSSKFILECKQRGLKPKWDCYQNNFSSNKLAKSLGFKNYSKPYNFSIYK